MSQSHTGNRTHDLAVSVAESTRQTASKGATQAAVKAADIAFYQSCLASAVLNGVNTQQYETALQELGTR